MSGLQADNLFSSMTVFYPVVSYYSSITSWTNRDISVVLIVSSFASLFCPARVRLNTHSKHVQKIQLPASTSLMLSEIDFLNEAFCIFYVSITLSCHCKVLRCISCVVIRIGACRAVWVPGQDLATPDLMRNCNVFFHYTVRYTYVRACV